MYTLRKQGPLAGPHVAGRRPAVGQSIRDDRSTATDIDCEADAAELFDTVTELDADACPLY